MLSVANVRSAGGAASYFAKDNYYANADAYRLGQWVGKGAERLGLSGPVAELTEQGALHKRRGTMQGWLTSADALALEGRMLAGIAQG
ncbi:MAG: relaxase domain-containing protein [Proteobacteria bacterium]|nr:relaxase domain-containing protein [Pseudomonadota bacterium]